MQFYPKKIVSAISALGRLRKLRPAAAQTQHLTLAGVPALLPPMQTVYRVEGIAQPRKCVTGRGQKVTENILSGQINGIFMSSVQMGQFYEVVLKLKDIWTKILWIWRMLLTYSRAKIEIMK